MFVAMLVSLPGTQEKPEEIEDEPPPTLEELIPSDPRSDSDMKLRVLIGGDITELTMDRYLIGAVAAEMPATFGLEALKAQAVAARTNALYNVHIMQKSRHPDADVCADFACCTAYNSDERLRERWGDDYYMYISKVVDAVVETDGVYLSFDGEPILAVFHSSSATKTETSGNVWVTELPYLMSVESPETALDVPNFITTVTISHAAFIETITDSFPDADLVGDEETWINDEDMVFSDSGRVLELEVGGVTIRGTEIRSMFNLRSTAFSYEWTSSGIVFTVTGFGHGVGMSQYGANVMARNGRTYRDILSAYYTDISFEVNFS